MVDITKDPVLFFRYSSADAFKEDPDFLRELFLRLWPMKYIILIENIIFTSVHSLGNPSYHDSVNAPSLVEGSKS